MHIVCQPSHYNLSADKGSSDRNAGLTGRMLQCCCIGSAGSMLLAVPYYPGGSLYARNPPVQKEVSLLNTYVDKCVPLQGSSC